ncbi:MAG TPA: EcsC family protein [Clostridiaceae bacterium]|nr:EcsC family protein [Clostridiaceae bacterium]
MRRERELEKQLNRLEKKEYKILNKEESKLMKTRVAPAVEKIQEKIPEKLNSALETAFFKGFKLVFEKGNAYIEKTYNKEKLKMDYAYNNSEVNKKMNWRRMRKLDKTSRQSQTVSSLISVIEGSVLGALGIGLPDIPLFISVIMRNINEIAYSYGYNPEKDEEREYILMLICGAITKGQRQRELNEKIDLAGSRIDRKIAAETNLEEQIKETAKALSESMLTAKFIQGIPIVGAIGGIVNYSIIKRIGEYASLKYKKRYLNRKK